MKATLEVRRRGSPRLDDAWNARVRNERPHTRADRNYLELLQEMRLIQTAVTILFAMLLTIPFSVRFGYADEFQRVVYVATLACSAVASVLLITPVAYHRTLFQRGRKSEIVVSAHRLIRVGLLILAVAVVGLPLLVLDMVIGRGPAVVISLAIGALILGQWFVLPALASRAGPAQNVSASAQQSSTAERPSPTAPSRS